MGAETKVSGKDKNNFQILWTFDAAFAISHYTDKNVPKYDNTAL